MHCTKLGERELECTSSAVPAFREGAYEDLRGQPFQDYTLGLLGGVETNFNWFAVHRLEQVLLDCVGRTHVASLNDLGASYRLSGL